MKKVIALVLSLVMVLITAVAIRVVTTKIEVAYNNGFGTGFEAGMRHVIEDAELWVEIHNGIVEILIDIDGEIYVHEGGVDYVD